MPRRSSVQSTIENLNQLLVYELQELYSCESLLVEFLPQVLKEAHNEKFKEAIKNHLNETEGQMVRLNRIFKILGEEPIAQTSFGIEGIIKECNELQSLHMESSTKDAALIACAQKIEHYEITSYGTARAHAKLLNLNEIADLLKESEDEEINADKGLTKIAEGSFFSTGVNTMACEAKKDIDSKNKK